MQNLRPMPIADLDVLEQRMRDVEFINEVVDGIFEDKTWLALSQAFADGGHTESLKFHNLGEKFAELFQAEAWKLAQHELTTEWESDPYEYPHEIDDDC